MLPKEVSESLSESQDHHHENWNTLSKVGSLEESLQGSSKDEISDIQGKASPMVSDDKIVEKIMVLNYEMYKSRENNMKKSSEQRLSRNFNLLCSLISDLLNILHPKVNFKSIEQTMNPEDFHLNSLRLIITTNALTKFISGNPAFKRILMGKGPSQMQCYHCQRIGHIAKHCHFRKIPTFTTKRTGFKFHKYQKRP